VKCIERDSQKGEGQKGINRLQNVRGQAMCDRWNKESGRVGQKKGEEQKGKRSQQHEGGLRFREKIKPKGVKLIARHTCEV